MAQQLKGAKTYQEQIENLINNHALQISDRTKAEAIWCLFDAALFSGCCINIFPSGCIQDLLRYEQPGNEPFGYGYYQSGYYRGNSRIMAGRV